MRYENEEKLQFDEEKEDPVINQPKAFSGGRKLKSKQQTTTQPANQAEKNKF